MYVAVKGGERAILNSYRLLDEYRRGDPAVPELSLAQIREQMPLAVSRVMAEGSLHDPHLAALAIKQAAGDLIEAKVNYRLLLAFSPALAHSNFAKVGEALASANLSMARRVIEEIYGQSQAIFRRQAVSPAMTIPPSSSSRLGVLVDSSA